MASNRPFAVSIYRFKFNAWAWITVLLYLSSFAHGLEHSILSSDQSPPRTCCLTFAYDYDLPGTLYSTSQVEDTFDSRYQYHWVFFIPRELDETFKRLTFNATNVTSVYEAVRAEHWSVPHCVDRRLLAAQGIAPGLNDDTERPISDVRQTYRLNSHSFAREEQLRCYHWLRRVESGTQFTRDIHLDLLRFMRDNGIAYGFNKAVPGGMTLRDLSSRIRSFADKIPGLLLEEADASWGFDIADLDQCSCIAVYDMEGSSVQDSKNRHRKQMIWEGHPSPVSHSRADWRQVTNEDNDYTETKSLADSFTSWLSGLYESSLYQAFEIGSLAFLGSSPYYLAFFDHLHSAGDFYYNQVEEIPVHTLSASMFLPRQSVWSFRRRDTRHLQQRPSPPEETPDPEFDLTGVKADRSNSMTSMNKTKRAMNALLTQWEWMAHDMGRQKVGLMSGCTTIDTRNFAIIGLCILPGTI